MSTIIQMFSRGWYPATFRNYQFVIPAKAGIQFNNFLLGAGLHRNGIEHLPD